jgi:TRAP-type C4-dicarboxylate transport system substrate-binding protein
MWKGRIIKRLVGIFTITSIAVTLSISYISNAFSEQIKIVWDYALQGTRREYTEPIHKWADEMGKKTNGLWIINFHYGEVLMSAKETLDGLKAGAFQAAMIVPEYIPGKIPLHTIMGLPFISPNSLQSSKMWIELWKHPAFQKELSKWNVVGLIPTGDPQFNIMGRKPLRTLSDFQGLRLRVGGETSKVMQEFGVVPVMTPPADSIEALEKGTIDAVSMAWFSFGSWKVHEISKYALNINMGTVSNIQFANKDAWEALPEEYKKYHIEWMARSPEICATEYDAAIQKWMPEFKKYVEIAELSSSDRAKMVAKAENVYEKWVEAREKEGLPGKEIMKFFLEKRKEIAGY